MVAESGSRPKLRRVKGKHWPLIRRQGSCCPGRQAPNGRTPRERINADTILGGRRRGRRVCERASVLRWGPEHSAA